MQLQYTYTFFNMHNARSNQQDSFSNYEITILTFNVQFCELNAKENVIHHMQNTEGIGRYIV